MKSLARSTVLAVAVLAVLPLSGCAAAHSSDSEALQAATHVYRLQLATEAAVSEAGVWLDAAFEGSASETYVRKLHAQVEADAAKGLSVTGPVKWVRSSLVQFSERDATDTVILLVCVDRSGQTTHDKNGLDIAGSAAQALETRRVTLSGPDLKSLKVDQADTTPAAESIC